MVSETSAIDNRFYQKELVFGEQVMVLFNLLE